jgi:hypothetical protein
VRHNASILLLVPGSPFAPMAPCFLAQGAADLATRLGDQSLYFTVLSTFTRSPSSLDLSSAVAILPLALELLSNSHYEVGDFWRVLSLVSPF